MKEAVLSDCGEIAGHVEAHLVSQPEIAPPLPSDPHSPVTVHVHQSEDDLQGDVLGELHHGPQQRQLQTIHYEEHCKVANQVPAGGGHSHGQATDVKQAGVHG